jgi:hypothetical protein
MFARREFISNLYFTFIWFWIRVFKDIHLRLAIGGIELMSEKFFSCFYSSDRHGFLFFN